MSLSLVRCSVARVSFVLVLAGWSLVGQAADWPTCRGNNSRSSYVTGELPAELDLAWRYVPPQPPSPAWPPPARGSYWQQLTSIEPRVVDDHTFHPVVAHGTVYFGSSADDTLRAVDLATGELRWSFTCEGPIRYAPTVAGDRLLFGSDDGHVYALQAHTGELIWRQRLSPVDRRMPGNGRLISAWPVRSSVAVDGDTAYAFAGLFPSQKVYAAALSVEDGGQLWSREFNGSPQGYVLLDEQRIVAPMGRANPVVFRRDNGDVLGTCPGAGGTYALIEDARVVSGPGNSRELIAADAASRKQLARFAGRQIAATPKVSYLLSDSNLRAIDRTAAASEDELWQLDIDEATCLAACDNIVVVGQVGEVWIVESTSGQIVRKLPTSGKPMGIAIADSRIVVSSDAGEISCYAPEVGDDTATIVESRNSSNTSDDSPNSVEFRDISKLVTGKGYGLIAGADSLELINHLLAHSELQLVVVDNDTAAVQRIRENFIAGGGYGRRITALAVDGSELPLVSRFANVVVATQAAGGKACPYPRNELLRCLRPFGGVAWLDADAEPIESGPLAGAGRWTHLFGSPANTAHSGDSTITSRLQLQWFGGPGPRLMTDRHLRGPAPLVDNGRMIVPGENLFVGVDAFNGTVLWQLDAPGSQHYSIPYDCGYFALEGDTFAVAVGDVAWLVDAASGALQEQRELPAAVAKADSMWGYLALLGDSILATSQQRTAARTEPSRALISSDYNNHQPLVTSHTIFRTNRDTGELAWSHDGVIINPSIAADGAHVVFVQSNNNELRDHSTGRIKLADLVADGAQIVCLDMTTGARIWKRDLPDRFNALTNILYSQIARDKVIVSGSLHENNDTLYRVAVLSLATGDVNWQAEHFKGRPGAFTHGEQVHHPVVMGNRLIAEPAIYDIESGDRLTPDGAFGAWTLNRPGHSCGTLTAGGECLFFRAANPTMLDLASASESADRYTKLAPSRPGCWINIVPAGGLVLIPEASASCVCLYSLQTSMAFAPADD